MRVLVVVCLGIVLAGCGGARRNYPRWVLATPAAHQAACVEAQAFVRVSGKTGVGLTIGLRSRGDCTVRIARAELVIGGRRLPAELTPAQVLPGRSSIYLWLPFRFDNESLWNDGERRGQFELALEVDGVVGEPWIIPATHQFVGGRWHPDPTGYRR